MRIKIKFPAIIFYTNKVKKYPNHVVRGKAMGPFIIIGTPYADDKRLLAHEFCHVKEWWTHGGIIHNILYGALRPYRLRSECKAYYKQWLLPIPSDEERKADYADRIWLFYNLKYPREYVQKVFYSYFN